jgi:hypothetical protein
MEKSSTGHEAGTEDGSHGSPVHLQPAAEQWIPVSSPSATKPMSPAAAKELNKTAANVGAVANNVSGGKAAAPDTFMLLPSVQDNKPLNPTTVASETCGVDKLNIGYAPVDIRGKLLVDMKNTGGWRAALFIFGTISFPFVKFL